ncbi:hypothetical protein Gotur_034853 [Gossypium turneri]
MDECHTRVGDTFKNKFRMMPLARYISHLRLVQNWMIRVTKAKFKLKNVMGSNYHKAE